jgi:GT2 family glycosyltransferase
MDQPVLSVVIGTFNRKDLLQRAVESILTQTRPVPRIYVTDAGSTDGTIEYLQSIDNDLVVPILVGKKIGQAKAYNDVFRGVTTPYVAWLSDDNEVVNHGLDIGVRILEGNPNIGMVGLKVKDVQGPFVDAPYIGGISKIGILNVNQGLLRTSVLRDVDYFSELFGFYGIDPDLTAKVLLSGHDIVYTRAVAIHHYRDWADDPKTERYAALKANQQRSLDLYVKKYGSLLGDDALWSRKQSFWKYVRTRLGPRYQPSSTKPFLGAIARDWNNMFMARFISPFDAMIHARKEYHLRQHIRTSQRPPHVPLDATISAE